MRPPVVVALLVAVLGLGACAGAPRDNADDYEGDERAVADAVFSFRDAVAERNEEEVCDAHFTAELRDAIIERGEAADRGTTCPQVLQDSIQDIDATKIDITDIRITGSTAEVDIKTDLTEGDDPVDTLTLTDERGWRISELPESD